MKRRLALLLSLFLLMPALALAVGKGADLQLKAGIFEPPRLAPEFSLRGSDGTELTLSRYRGKPVLLVFGYTNCPAVCPTTLATLAQVRKVLSSEGMAVQVVYVTVDPERDDLHHLKQYLAAFDSTFVGGTAASEELALVHASYGVTSSKVPMASGSYGMNHSTSTYLIDRKGRLRAMMPYGHDAKDFLHDLRLLLVHE